MRVTRAELQAMQRRLRELEESMRHGDRRRTSSSRPAPERERSRQRSRSPLPSRRQQEADRSRRPGGSAGAAADRQRPGGSDRRRQRSPSPGQPRRATRRRSRSPERLPHSGGRSLLALPAPEGGAVQAATGGGSGSETRLVADVAAVGAAKLALAEALVEVQGLLTPLRAFAPLVASLPAALRDTAASVGALQEASLKLREQQDAAKARTASLVVLQLKSLICVHVCHVILLAMQGRRLCN